MAEMFCFQCQQTAGGSGCVRTGVCGKQPETAQLQDALLDKLVRLAQACERKGVDRVGSFQSGGVRLAQACERKGWRPDEVTELLTDGLFITLTNVNFDDGAIRAFTQRIDEMLAWVDAPKPEKDPGWLWRGETDLVSLRSTLLFGLKGMAAYAHHARELGYTDSAVDTWFYKGLTSLAQPHSVEEWLDLILEFGRVNFQCMALLDQAHTETFGHPVPTRVNTDIQKGPFIVVTGHDLKDLRQLLKQTAGKGVNVYTHGEMLPAHGYPELKKYTHLVGHFGTAWQNQQTEFADLPAPVLFTTNCLMPPRPSYADRIYTTSVVGYEGIPHIPADENGHKDFTPLIQQALSLGGYETDQSRGGLNGGHMLTTGFARNAVLSQAPAILNAIKSGAIKHIFLVGGCDGAHPGRNYYTEFVKRTPMDSLVLTLACGKFRFNDLDLGEIHGIPRILDIGQCNDAYSAVQIALALAEAFDCSINDLPLTLVLSWYEQKAVCILLSLLALGVKNIYLGPTLPAFLSEPVVKMLVDAFGLQPTTHPQQDLDAILHRG